MTTTAPTSRGLENVVATSTKLSAIDGTAGRLSYVGYDIHNLAERASFEEVFYLLWFDNLPNAAQLRDFKAQLAADRALIGAEADIPRHIPRSGHGMDALRSMVSMLGQLDDHAADIDDPKNVDRIGIRIAAKMPTLIAAWARIREGKEPIAPAADLDHAADFLYMLHGKRPSPAAAQACGTYLMVLAEHGLNASTFAARIAIGAQADVYCAVVAAISTLKGLLHGGANQKAMETFLEIGHPENARAYIDQLVANHGRLMGVGHRIYRVEDPRVRHLRKQVGILAVETKSHWQEVADEVGRVIHEHPHFVQRQLNPNVEFYSAPLLYELGLPLDLFTTAFAISRIAGWTAHIREQLADNRLIRPKAEYIGPEPRNFVPIDER